MTCRRLEPHCFGYLGIVGRNEVGQHQRFDSRLGGDFADLLRETGIDVPTDYLRELASLADLIADGIVEMDDTGLRVTELGAPLLRVVAMRFDAHFAPAAKERRHAMSV